MAHQMKVTLLNTSIIALPTADSVGRFNVSRISLEEAQYMVASAIEDGGLTSAVGHESTAKLMSDLLGVDVPVSRHLFEQNVDDYALVFKLGGRPEPGRELSREEVESIGYSWMLIERIR